MKVKKAGGKIYGVELTAAERKAMNKEIMNQLGDYTRKHAVEVDAMFLWFLQEELGFGYKRLKQVFTNFHSRIMAMCDRYEMYEEGDDIWLCTEKLKEKGIILEEWLKEVGD